MPYLSGTLRPQGKPADRLHAARRSGHGELDRRDRRPTAKRRDKANCPTNDTSPPPPAPTRPASSPATAASTRSRRSPSATRCRATSSNGRPTWRALADETGAPANCVYPEPGTAEVAGDRRLLGDAQPVHALPLAARPRRLLGQRRATDRARHGPEEGRDDAELLLHLAQPLATPGWWDKCPPARRRGAAAADAFLGQLAPKILKSAAFKKDGPADRQLRPDQPPGGRSGHRRGRSRPGRTV